MAQKTQIHSSNKKKNLIFKRKIDKKLKCIIIIPTLILTFVAGCLLGLYLNYLELAVVCFSFGLIWLSGNLYGRLINNGNRN
jgi:1,4-dihydroxy-2-naphthoate octaprenyltransferase